MIKKLLTATLLAAGVVAPLAAQAETVDAHPPRHVVVVHPHHHVVVVHPHHHVVVMQHHHEDVEKK
jgi:hypothetical protein